MEINSIHSLSFKILAITFIICLIASLILLFWMPLGQSFRIPFSLIYVLFLPGLVWTYVFFENKDIDAIERITLSFILSISIVPLVVFFSNTKFGIKITALNVFFIILIICFIASLIKFISKTIKQQPFYKKFIDSFKK